MEVQGENIEVGGSLRFLFDQGSRDRDRGSVVGEGLSGDEVFNQSHAEVAAEDRPSAGLVGTEVVEPADEHAERGERFGRCLADQREPERKGLASFDADAALLGRVQHHAVWEDIVTTLRLPVCRRKQRVQQSRMMRMEFERAVWHNQEAKSTEG
jgi:hypothetical protein